MAVPPTDGLDPQQALLKMDELCAKDLWVHSPATRGEVAIRALLVRPHVIQSCLPGLLLLHEVGGINPSMRLTANAFARAGFVVLVPDLYSFRLPLVTLCQLVAGTALRPLRNQPLTWLRDCLTALANQPEVSRERLGVVGYSMGAGYALQVACVDPRVRTAALFCGQLPRPIQAVANVRAIVASYADRDLTTRGLAPKLERELRLHSVEHDVKVYRGTQHAFYDPLASTYNASAAQDAWSRTLAFILSTC